MWLQILSLRKSNIKVSNSSLYFLVGTIFYMLTMSMDGTGIKCSFKGIDPIRETLTTGSQVNVVTILKFHLQVASVQS